MPKPLRPFRFENFGAFPQVKSDSEEVERVLDRVGIPIGLGNQVDGLVKLDLCLAFPVTAFSS